MLGARRCRKKGKRNTLIKGEAKNLCSSNHLKRGVAIFRMDSFESHRAWGEPPTLGVEADRHKKKKPGVKRKRDSGPEKPPIGNGKRS